MPIRPTTKCSHELKGRTSNLQDTGRLKASCGQDGDPLADDTFEVAEFHQKKKKKLST